MKILLTHRYFWPDTAPYALMLRSIGEGLVDAGHDVHIFASIPSYRDQSARAPKRQFLGRLNVRRSWVFQENRRIPALRAVNVLLYCAALFFHILRMRPDVVTASTFPPVIAGWSASLAARLVGARFIYHLQDIHPEVSQYSGGRLGRRLPAYILRFLDNQTLRRASAIVLLSKDMANTLEARGVGPLPVHIINNFLLNSFDGTEALSEEYQKTEGKRRVIFAGNLGRYQNLDLLTDGVAGCFESHPELELMLLGDGAALPALKTKWENHPQVRFVPFLPFSQASILIEDSDIGLVSLAPNIYRVAYPSKVLTYLGLGVPVLALIEPESELAKEIKENDLGTVPDTETAAEVEKALKRMLNASPSKANILNWSDKTGSIEIILPRWQQLITSSINGE